MYRDIATAVYRRAVEDGNTGNAYQMPGWAFAIFFLDAIVFLPIFLLVGYTFNNLYPVLAMVEDPSPPVYAPVSLNPETESLPGEDGLPVADEAARGSSQQSHVVTSSFRAIHRTLQGISGWRSNFRGLPCWISIAFCTAVVYAIINAIPFVPSILAALISAIALVQLYTAWLHVVISMPSSKRFWKRLPDFRKAFQATAIPTVLYFVAIEIQQTVPKWLAHAMGMNRWDPKNPSQVPEPRPSDAWKGILVVLAVVVLTVFVTIPAHVVLTRVQASLLPEEDETIVPFDRSFQGTVEPAIVGGKGYVSIIDAWKTFSRASWIRLVKLYVKIFAAGLAAWALLAVVAVPEAILIMRNSQKVPSQ